MVSLFVSSDGRAYGRRVLDLRRAVCHWAAVFGCWEEGIGSRGPREAPIRACVCVENEQGPLYRLKPPGALPPLARHTACLGRLHRPESALVQM